MSNADLRSAAEAYVTTKWGPQWRVAHAFELDDPQGIFFWVDRRDGGDYLDGPTPFFVFSRGDIMQFSSRDLRRALERFQSPRSDEGDIVRAYFDPGDGRDERVTREFIRTCLAPHP
jgi:hypothetical protein